MIQLVADISEHQREWRNSPEIYAFTRQNGLISEADHEKWLKRIKEDPTIKMFGIVSVAENSLGYLDELGTAGLTGISQTHGSAEFSLFIAPRFQGKGYGKAALKELLRYGFKHLRLHSIWGETFVDNPAYEMFLGLGMRHEGHAKERYFKDGVYKDTYYIGITDEEARRQPWWE